MESNREKIEFTIVAGEEIIQRCLIEINGLTGSDFELVKFERFEVPLSTINATKWKPEYIFKLGSIFQRFSDMDPNEWRIPG